MEHLISINTTARYYTKGSIGKEIRAVWFVFHGYGMRADSFLEQFDCIADELTLIVAPEGMFRFYNKGTHGKIGANWMTSDLREKDIEHNITYLNSVIKELFEKGLNKDTQIGVLGFSQGGPTAFRWVSQLENKVGQLVAWGTDIPKDVYSDIHKLNKVNESNIQLVIGSKDEYISTEQVDELIMELHDAGVNFDYHTFDGTHELNEEKVRYFHARLMDDNLEY